MLLRVSRQRAFQHFELLRAHLEDGRPLTAIAREARLSYRTLQYWLEPYRTYGLVELVDKPRTDRGRRRKLSAALREVIEGNPDPQQIQAVSDFLDFINSKRAH